MIGHANLTAEQMTGGIKVAASPAKWGNILLQRVIEGRLSLAVFERDVQGDILEGRVTKAGLHHQADITESMKQVHFLPSPPMGEWVRVRGKLISFPLREITAVLAAEAFPRV